MSNNTKVSMPHRGAVNYETNDLEILFEVEVLSDGVVLYINSPKFIRGEKKDLSKEIVDVKVWLESKFSKVEIDNSHPPIFNI